MEDTKRVEILIWKMHKEKRELSVIADELLKLWDKNKLTINAKLSVGRFCILNGFIISLISSLRKDLKAGAPLCWPLIFSCCVNFEKVFLDAFLVGATQDNSLRTLAIAALEKHNPDTRWTKILNEELNEKTKGLQEMRDKFVAELKIFENESMREQGALLVKKLRVLFPDDDYISRTERKYAEWELSDKLMRIREKFPQTERGLKSVAEKAPEDLADSVRREFNKLNLESAYELAISLQQMGLTSLALETLDSQKENWGVREHIIEVEFLLAKTDFVEALSKSQNIIKNFSMDSEVIESCLYYSAIAYYELNDVDQALNILRAIQSQNPDYRNINELIKIWELET